MSPVDLYQVVARFFRTAGSLAESSHNLPDLFNGKSSGDRCDTRCPDCRGRDILTAVNKGISCAPGMVDLGTDPAACGMDAVCEDAVALDLAIIPKTRETFIGPAVFKDRNVLGHSQAPAALCLVLVVAYEALRDCSIGVGQAGDSCGADHPVFQFQCADLHRRKQEIKHSYYPLCSL